MLHISSRSSSFIILLALCFASFLLSTTSVQAEEATVTHVYVKVVDSTTHYPIPDAIIIFWNPKENLIIETKTNASGYCDIEVIGLDPVEVYAYYDNETTLGFDYVPSSQKIYPRGLLLNVSFTLLPGASINVQGDLQLLRSFEFSTSLTSVDFNVVDEFGLLSGTDAVTKYGENSPVNELLNINARTVVVPSNMPVKVEVGLNYSDGLRRYFTIDDEGSYLNLAQGSQLALNLRPFALRVEIDHTYARLQLVQAMVNKAGGAGFYASYEGIKLSRAENLVKDALSALNEGDYDVTYADLHEAYLIIDDLEITLPDMYRSVSQSVFFIIPFLGFTAVVVASFLFDEHLRRLIVSLGLYGIFLGLLYFLYPGFTLLQKPAYSRLAGPTFGVFLIPMLVAVPFLAAFFMIQVLPYLFREKTSMEGLRVVSALAAAFSLAARNLRRRKLRTFLTSAFMLTSVFAFIVLTSFSFEHGFFMEKHRGKAPSEGLLIRQGPINRLTPFEPITQTVFQWVKERPESVLVVPKMEKTPNVGYDSLLYAPESHSSLYAWELGVFPSLEVKVTKMDGIITQGRFLSDRDLDGILISEEVAKTLQVEVNETIHLKAFQEVTQIYDRRFTVTGIFNSGKLGGLRDLDGAPLNPQRITIERAPPPMMEARFLEYVPNDRVVIMHAETAQSLGMVVSRIDVQTQSPEDTETLARLAVLVWPNVQAFASVQGGISHLFIGSSYVMKGFAEGLVPLVLVALNVGIMMLTVVYERKREMTIMSTVGLNPFHISAMFVAEALVIGVVAGSLGYLLGLIGYRFLALFSVSLAVKQKVEPFWCILALGFSITAAVLGSALPAIKASIIATPSLVRKWKIGIEEKPKTAEEPWILKIPIQIRREDLGKFFSFMEKHLEKYSSGIIERVDDLKISREETADPTGIRLSFTYVFSEKGVVVDNELIPVKISGSDQYAVKLKLHSWMGSYSGGTFGEAYIRRAATFIRRLILEYSYKPET